MSLVERAIDKLRRSGPGKVAGGASPDDQSAIGTLTVTTRALEEEALPGSVDEPSRRILVDRDALRAAGYLPETTEDRRFADQYRQIKRPLIATARTEPEQPGGNSRRLIMMASALPGDGKTFTSINLALSMARERDISVVLVDADVAKPHISRIFGVEGEQGLLDSISDESLDIESLILPTDVKGLSILPAGKQQDGATELLASARFAQVVARMISRNPRRVVLFDSSPLLASSESKALSAVVGQVVMVVRAVKTPREAVLDALEQLGDDTPVRLVLNQGRPSLMQSYYGDGLYGYGTENDQKS